MAGTDYDLIQENKNARTNFFLPYETKTPQFCIVTLTHCFPTTEMGGGAGNMAGVSSLLGFALSWRVDLGQSDLFTAIVPHMENERH